MQESIKPARPVVHATVSGEGLITITIDKTENASGYRIYVKKPGSFFRRKWRVSRKGNEFLKIDGHVIVIYPLQKNNSQKWGFSIDNEYSNIFYPTREHALGAAFDKIEEIRGKG